MSKKLNTSGSATPKYTIFKYFSRTPVSAETKNSSSQSPATPNSVHKDKGTLKSSPEKSRPVKRNLASELPSAKKNKEQTRKVDDEDEDGIQERATTKRKRRAVIASSSDEESDHELKLKNRPNNDGSSSDEESDASASSEDGVAAKKQAKPNRQQKKPKLDPFKNNNNNNNNNNNTLPAGSLADKLQQLQEETKDSQSSNGIYDAKIANLLRSKAALDEPLVWPHQKLEFLKPDKIKDKNGRRPDHPDYDAATLQVPLKFLDSLSPGVRQWWLLKSDNFDCVLFFKVGKFYELYHMDADVGVTELGFTYMRGEFAHSGFPEVSFDKMATVLVDRGYKVARVEQTETPDMMTERCARTKGGKFDKVVRREICQITNKGTQVFGSQCQITPRHQPNYLLAVAERNLGAASRYGIAYGDTSIGDFYLGEFDDDKNCSRLLTLLAHHMPVLLLSEKGSLSERTQEVFRTFLGSILKDQLPANGPQSCSAEKTLKHLSEQYFAKGGGSEDNWPLTIRHMQAESDHLGLSPKEECKLVLKALGECIAYLRKCHLEEKILPMARFHLYTPPDMLELHEPTASRKMSAAAKPTALLPRSHMVLDATTIANLRITGDEYSLLSTLDNCCTKFGKRLLHHWVCSPSCDLAVIVERQEAISDLLQHESEMQELRALLATMPDFERHLAQIHMFGNKAILTDHPDGRAVMFEEKMYNKKKIQNFIGILKGFEALTQLPSLLVECESPLIRRLSQHPDDGIFPQMTKILTFFKNAFDHEEAAKSGVIAPERGVDDEYDASLAKIADINSEVQAYLVEQERYFGCRIVYFGTDKKRFQLEVPESNARKAGKAYSLEGQKKGTKPCRRYSTNETKAFLKQMQAAEDERNGVLKALSWRIFEKFSEHYTIWKCCVDCVATLDVLATLAEYARNQNIICVPDLRAPSASEKNSAFINLVQGYHPCALGDNYIPNGIVLGGDSGVSPLSILTGPNMGGKSTLMRQIGLLVVMAQIGCHIPAESCQLTIVDRIFTRLGAQDDILAGHSTFLVELNETSLILKHATPHSLVLLDELGRGTATYDGTAIAASVVDYLAELQCRTLFSTHYHNLIDYFHKDERITLGHMACMVENDDTDDPTQETVTFLYKYSAGACPKSYGFNAAKLAGMPHPIIIRAYELSKRVEAIALKRKIAAGIVTAGGCDSKATVTATLSNLLKQLQLCHL